MKDMDDKCGQGDLRESFKSSMAQFANLGADVKVRLPVLEPGKSGFKGKDGIDKQ